MEFRNIFIRQSNKIFYLRLLYRYFKPVAIWPSSRFYNLVERANNSTRSLLTPGCNSARTVTAPYCGQNNWEDNNNNNNILLSWWWLEMVWVTQWQPVSPSLFIRTGRTPTYTDWLDRGDRKNKQFRFIFTYRGYSLWRSDPSSRTFYWSVILAKCWYFVIVSVSLFFLRFTLVLINKAENSSEGQFPIWTISCWC